MEYRDRADIRMSEYEKMMNDLEKAVPPELEGVFDRASARERKHRRVMRFVKSAGEPISLCHPETQEYLIDWFAYRGAEPFL